jgi:hypothetical protein
MDSGCNGGGLIVGNSGMIIKNHSNGEASFRIHTSVRSAPQTAWINAEQAKQIVDNLSTQFNLEYAGVSDVYKMIRKAYTESDSLAILYANLAKIMKRIEINYPQVKK